MPKHYKRGDKPMKDLWKRAGFPSKQSFDRHRMDRKEYRPKKKR